MNLFRFSKSKKCKNLVRQPPHFLRKAKNISFSRAKMAKFRHFRHFAIFWHGFCIKANESIIHWTSKKESKMKLVTAYIQPERLNLVKQALYEKNIFKMSVTNVLGCGQQKGYNQRFRGVVTEVNLLKKICLKIAVNDDFVQPCIDAIIAGARTGEIGDGKIFVTSLEQCIRIRTGETGSDAIG